MASLSLLFGGLSSISRDVPGLSGRQSLREISLCSIVCLVILGVSLLWVHPALGDDNGKIDFDIPRSNADHALNLFARQADIQLLYPYNTIKSVRVRGLSGRYSVDEGLLSLLQETCLEAVFSDDNRLKKKAANDNKGIAIVNIQKCQKKSFWGAFSTAILGIMASPSGYAQSENQANNLSAKSVIEEVIIFARKREESVQDVALSVTALTADDITNKGLTSALDLTRVSPNLTTNSAYGETQPNYAMRGISVANEFNPNQASPIGVYVNESYMSNRISHGMSLFDIERIEVLRGPQGTLYGRNTTGGAISIFTKKPTLDGGYSGYAEAGVGNKNRWEVNGGLDATLNQAQTLGMRVAFNRIKSDGLIKNLAEGKEDANSADTLVGRITLRYMPSDDLDMTLMAYDGRNKPTSAAVFSLGVNTVTGNPAPGGVNPFTGYSRSSLDFFETEMEEAGTYQTDGSGIMLRMQWDLSDMVQLTSITSFDDGSQDLDFDADGSPFDLLTDKWKADFEQFNQELRASIQASDAVNLTVGAYYGQDEVHIDYYNRFFGFAPFMFETTADSLQKRDSVALFSDADWQLSERLKLSAGLRWTRDTIEVTDYFATYAGVTTIGPDFSTPEEESTEMTGRLALDYKFSDNVMGYAYYSRGYRGGGFNAATSSGLQSLTYVEPEFVDTYEVGLKTQSDDRHVTLNMALFYNDYTDQQLQELITAISYLRNAGESTLQGAEFEFTYHATSSLTVMATLGYLDAKYDELTLSQVDLSGNRLPFAPDWTGNIGFNWDIATVGQYDIAAFVNGSYVDHQYFSPFNTQAGDQNFQQDGYWLVDGNLRFDSETFYGSLWVKNLFNDEHFVYGIDTNGLGYSYLVQGNPRTFGVKVGMRF